MTMPEWAAIILVTSLIMLLGFLGKRMIKGSDEQTVALTAIGAQLQTINVRIGEGDVWMKMHAREDDRMFRIISDVHKEMWYAINNRKPETPDLSQNLMRRSGQNEETKS